MALTDTWARYLAHDAPWMESARAVLSPLKNSIIHSHPTVTHLFRQVDTVAENILSFYAPDLPPSSRQNNGLPLMDGKDVFIVISLYLLLVAFSLLVGRGAAPQAAVQKREKPLLEKIGPVFFFQAIYNIAQVCLPIRVSLCLYHPFAPAAFNVILRRYFIRYSFPCAAVYVHQVVLCGFLVVRVFDVWRAEEYSFMCNRFNVPNTRMAEVTWFFYM